MSCVCADLCVVGSVVTTLVHAQTSSLSRSSSRAAHKMTTCCQPLPRQSSPASLPSCPPPPADTVTRVVVYTVAVVVVIFTAAVVVDQLCRLLLDRQCLSSGIHVGLISASRVAVMATWRQVMCCYEFFLCNQKSATLWK